MISQLNSFYNKIGVFGLSLILIYVLIIAGIYANAMTVKNNYVGVFPSVYGLLSDIFGFEIYNVGHVDEHYWISGAYEYYLFFVLKDFESIHWSNPHYYGQPPLGRYILGAGLEVLNGKLIDNAGGVYLWEKDIMNAFWGVNKFDFPYRKTLLPKSQRDYVDLLVDSVGEEKVTSLDIDDLTVGRKIMLMFAVLSSILIMGLTYKLSANFHASIFAGIVFLGNNISQGTFFLIFVEPICIYFTLITLISLFATFKSIDKGDNLGVNLFFVALVGIFMGSGFSVKFTTGYMFLAVGASFFVKTLLNPKNFWKIMSAGILCFIIATLTVILWNPLLYNNPLKGIEDMIVHRQNMMEIQGTLQNTTFTSIWYKVWKMFSSGIFMNQQSILIIAFHTVLLIHGLKKIIFESIDEIFKRGVGVYWVTFIWIISSIAVTGFSMHMDWGRYYIPIVTASTILTALGFNEMLIIAKKNNVSFTKFLSFLD